MRARRRGTMAPMASDEVLRSIDGHMARGNEIMARSNEIMDRHERFLHAVARRLDAQTRRLDRQTDVMAARFDEITAEFRDTRDERRAQTQALLRLLDRLSGGGEQPGPATG
jgi:septal ring factor EnvC (AmiA/AmiB activator)